MTDLTLQLLIKKLLDACKDSISPNLFTLSGKDIDTKMLEDDCKKFLKYLGYRVADPIEFNVEIKSVDALITFFYMLLNNFHPELMGKKNITAKDRGIAKRFVAVRLATGVSKKVALQQCADIIQTVFKQESKFNFNRPINFDFFGQGGVGWITDKAIKLINQREFEAKQKAFDILSEQRDEYKMNPNEELGISLDELLNEMEENN